MRWLEKLFQGILWSLIAVMGLYILYRGFLLGGESGFVRDKLIPAVSAGLQEAAVEVLAPALLAGDEEGQKEQGQESALRGGEADAKETEGENRTGAGDPETESEAAAKAGAESKADSESQAAGVPEGEHAGEADPGEKAEADSKSQAAGVPEDEQAGAGDLAAAKDEHAAGAETGNETAHETGDETGAGMETDGEQEALEASLPLAQMQDFTYLLNHYFTLDVSTATDAEQINYDALTSIDLSMEKKPEEPQILIYHTHSQEAFADSVEGDVSMSIVGVGSYLEELLEEKYGYYVIHHTAVYDMIDGQLDRNKAYELAEADISALLADNPSIEVVIDLHRDGVDGQKFVTEINGKPTARLMFFNGLSRTAQNGPVDYLPNPYIEDNLAFSFQLQLLAGQLYPGFTRNIYLQSLRYNLHLRPRSLLVECGTQLNTVQEEYNAMEPLADLLNRVLQP